MYNEERKLRYIEEKAKNIDTPQDIILRRFRQAEEMEISLQKDVADFTAYELMDFYKRRNFAALDTLIVTDSLLADYTDWCIAQSLVKDGQNHHVELTAEILKQCVNNVKQSRKILTREQLMGIIEHGNNGHFLTNAVDKFVLLALFEGIKGNDLSDLTTLKLSDFNGNIVHLKSGREFEVSNDLVKYATLASSTYEYETLSLTKPKPMPLDGEEVIKRYCNSAEEVDDFRRGRRVYTKIKKILNWLDLDKEISANTIYESGRIHFIKERAKELNESIYDYLTTCLTDKEYLKRYQKIARPTYYKKYGDYLE